MIALSLSVLPADAATFSNDQCKLMRMMRVDVRDICPAHARYTVQVRSQRAEEAALNTSINGLGPSGGINAGPAGRSAGHADSGLAGGSAAGPGVGPGGSAPGGSAPGGSTPDGGRPGFGGGDRGDYGGDGGNRPAGKPPAFIPKFDRNPAFKPPDLTKEQRRRLISKIRKEREEGDWNNGSNISKPGRPGKAHEGRNSR